jgi:hypothetical protein
MNVYVHYKQVSNECLCSLQAGSEQTTEASDFDVFRGKFVQNLDKTSC